MGTESNSEFCINMTYRPRLIPCLLLKGNSFYKTFNFNEAKYIGDPINTMRIFNEKMTDEIIILDIEASRNNHSPNFDLIGKLASECNMPLCFGGGIKTLDDVIKIIELGVEKISISSLAIENPKIVSVISEKIGSQSVVVSIDVKKRKFAKKYDIFTMNGTLRSEKELLPFLSTLQERGVGEIVLNDITRDGSSLGYDENLLKLMCENIKIPKTIIGGAKSLDEISKLAKKYDINGFGAGSLFVFKGRFKAVLIQYPSFNEREKLFIQK